MKRRNLMFAAAAAAIPAGCSTSVVNGVTTVTVNLASINAWSQAIANGVVLVLDTPAIATPLGAAKVAVIQAAVADMGNAVAALNAADAGQTSLTFTAASVPGAVTAFQNDSGTILANTQTVFNSLGGSIGANVMQEVQALQTILSLAAAVASLRASATLTPMTEPAALAVLGVAP